MARPRGWNSETAVDLFEGVIESRNGWHITKNGSVFVVKGSKTLGQRRVYGSVAQCSRCGRDYFKQTKPARPGHPGIYCSKRCCWLGTKRSKDWIEKSKRSKNKLFARRGVKTVTVDALASRLCRARGRCEAQSDGRICGGPFHWAHIISRSYRRVRWDADNCLCLCRDHHMFYTHRPIEWENFIIEKMGAAAYSELRKRAIDTGPKIDANSVYSILLSVAERSGLR